MVISVDMCTYIYIYTSIYIYINKYNPNAHLVVCAFPVPLFLNYLKLRLLCHNLGGWPPPDFEPQCRSGCGATSDIAPVTVTPIPCSFLAHTY